MSENVLNFEGDDQVINEIKEIFDKVTVKMVQDSKNKKKFKDSMSLNDFKTAFYNTH